MICCVMPEASDFSLFFQFTSNFAIYLWNWLREYQRAEFFLEDRLNLPHVKLIGI